MDGVGDRPATRMNFDSAEFFAAGPHNDRIASDGARLQEKDVIEVDFGGFDGPHGAGDMFGISMLDVGHCFFAPA